MAKEVEFEDRTSARQIREDPKFRPFLADSDDAREATVELKENIPDRALEDITGEAADSKKHRAREHGQAELTEAEKEKIDFSETNVMHARSAKAIARGKGVDDWTSYYDETLEVDEHRGVFERAKKDESGRSGIGRDASSEATQAEKQARAHHQRQQGELPQAKKYAFQGDQDAQGFVEERVDEPGGSFDDVFDMNFSRTEDGRLQGSGRDYERMEERHEERSQRAQTLDEKKTGQITRKPFVWVNNPGRYDYPGIDTVQPRELHDDRPERAKRQDEHDAAPIAPSKEAWAMHPGRYDWPGVDDVDPEAFHESRPEAAQTRDEQQKAPIADSKQQWAMHPGRYDWPGIDTPTQGQPPGMDRIREEADEFQSARRRSLFEVSPEDEVDRDRTLAANDVPLSPEEAFEGVGSDSMELSQTASPFGLAGGQEADMAFVEAEEERANDGGLLGGPGDVLDTAMGQTDEEIGEFVDDRDRQGSLAGFGMETDGTTHRETREAVEQATEFGVDDRSDPSRRNDDGGMMGGIQEGLGGFGEDDENEQNGGLFGF